MTIMDTRLLTFPGRPVHGTKLDSLAGRAIIDHSPLWRPPCGAQVERLASPLDRVECILWNRHGEIMEDIAAYRRGDLCAIHISRGIGTAHFGPGSVRGMPQHRAYWAL